MKAGPYGHRHQPLMWQPLCLPDSRSSKKDRPPRRAGRRYGRDKLLILSLSGPAENSASRAIVCDEFFPLSTENFKLLMVIFPAQHPEHPKRSYSTLAERGLRVLYTECGFR